MMSLLLCLLYSCASVKEYDKMYLNDPEVQLTDPICMRYEINYQLYREGASGANGAKTGGGCGCN